MVKILTTVNVPLDGDDYDVPSRYHGTKMMICRGIICNTDGIVIYVDQDGNTQTLKVADYSGQIFIDGIKQIKNTAHGTTVGAVSLLYG